MSDVTVEHLQEVLSRKTRDFSALRFEHLSALSRLKHEGSDRKTFALKGFVVGVVVGVAGVFSKGLL